jgi:DNA mismatch repair protein MutS2
MNRHWVTLEFPKILVRLAEFTDFSGGKDLALNLEPAFDIRLVREDLALTAEARTFLESKPNFALGQIRDIRPLGEKASHGVTLQPEDLLRVRNTLKGAARVRGLLTRLEAQFPALADIAWRIQSMPSLIEAIDKVLDDRGEIRDNASPELARIRRELRVTQERVQSRLQNLISSSAIAPYLQESLVTRRSGRFVIPVQSDFKGRVEGIIHDRSSSGATVFLEPAGVVEMNNALRELRLEEEDEILRLLRTLTAQVGHVSDELHHTLDALAAIDLVFAKARYADLIEASEPEIVPLPELPPEPGDGELPQANLHPGSVVALRSARHPLLDPEQVVPVDVVLDEETHVLVITGPNTGGKTVTLKTAGLLTLMAQAGMHIPVASGSRLSCFDAVVADIGDEQSIEQNLSTFSSHMRNILSFLELADHRTLVLLDELGAGTDPAEGSALARALLEAFRSRRSTVLIATHYPELKLHAHNTPGVRNASMEFDVETLAPTYRLTIGLPGRSNAFAIAERLGLPKSIVEHAQGMVSGESLRADEMLNDLHTLRVQEVEARDKARLARREAEDLQASLRDRLLNIEDERREILQEARERARAEVEALREEVDTLRRRLSVVSTRDVGPELEAVAEAIDQVDVKMPEPEPLVERRDAAPAGASEAVGKGDTVKLETLGVNGTVIEIDGDEAVVKAGAIRTRVPVDDLTLMHRNAPPKPESAGISVPDRKSPGVEIDLRGETVNEALKRLERYLDEAALASLPWVRVIHGKGTGTLRREVRRFVDDHPLVSSYESAARREGGDGATVVRLVKAS